MEDLGKPVPEQILELEKLIKDASHSNGKPIVDFLNTKIAFAGMTNEELKKAAWLFGLMNKYWLVGIGSKIGVAAIKLHLPFIETIVKNTIFQQFCGGTTLLETQKRVDRLAAQNCKTILDFGAEGKETETDFNATMNETIRAVEFAAQNEFVPVVSSKITGLARFGLLAKIDRGEALTNEEQDEYQNVLKRMDSICHVGATKGVSIYFDAEESWIQIALDRMINLMMSRYNKEKAIVFNTYQLYRTDRLQYMKDSYERAREEGWVLGAKLVRGAYMEKERDRAADNGYPSPIYPSKKATDQAYNDAVRFCVEHYDSMACCNATHNAESSMLMAELIVEKAIPRDHPNLIFSQLLGMSDNVTFNLAQAGFNVGKYVPYGPVIEVVPYLIRRAQENTSVTGDMSREYALVMKELKRRKLQQD